MIDLFLHTSLSKTDFHDAMTRLPDSRQDESGWVWSGSYEQDSYVQYVSEGVILLKMDPVDANEFLGVLVDALQVAEVRDEHGGVWQEGEYGWAP